MIFTIISFTVISLLIQVFFQLLLKVLNWNVDGISNRNDNTNVLRIDYCCFWPFCCTRTKLLLSISLLKILICIIDQLKDKY